LHYPGKEAIIFYHEEISERGMVLESVGMGWDANLWLSIVLRIIGAWIAGMMIGMNREKMQRPAGIRTFGLISLGSCLFTVLSVYSFGEGFGGDPGRISAQILTGIGFLGAGTILKRGFHVTGLTTAATLWTAAAIGMACGLGEFILAAGVTGLVMLTVSLIRNVEVLFSKKSKNTLLLEMKNNPDSFAQVFTQLLRHKVSTSSIYYEVEADKITLSVRMGNSEMERIMAHISDILAIPDVFTCDSH